MFVGHLLLWLSGVLGIMIPGRLVGFNSSYVEFELDVDAVEPIERIIAGPLNNFANANATYVFGIGKSKGLGTAWGKKISSILHLEHKGGWVWLSEKAVGQTILFTLCPYQLASVVELANRYRFNSVRLREVQERSGYFRQSHSFGPWEVHHNVTWSDVTKVYVKLNL